MSCPVNERLVHVALFVAAAAFYRQVLRNSSKPTHSKSEHRPLDQVHIGLIAAENEISMPGSPGMRQVSPERPLRKSIGSPPATPQRNDDTSFHFLTPISSSICLAEPLVRRIDQSSGQIIVIGIAGGSGSGKTTLARAIYESIGEDNITFLSHDSYYRDLTHLAEEERAKQVCVCVNVYEYVYVYVYVFVYEYVCVYVYVYVYVYMLCVLTPLYTPLPLSTLFTPQSPLPPSTPPSHPLYPLHPLRTSTTPTRWRPASSYST
ncbi:hypothetical protein B484DRAFT_144956 [Ochromonadaceae sp. CCMP2298]|nr:hypothetical protein B484DRAFT_144956 [Ochromonadaceae sp. CCMP2298]